MNMFVEFIILTDENPLGEERTIQRYLGRIPEPGENVSFPEHIEGEPPVWIPFKVIRINTFLSHLEPKYKVEIRQC